MLHCSSALQSLTLALRMDLQNNIDSGRCGACTCDANWGDVGCNMPTPLLDWSVPTQGAQVPPGSWQYFSIQVRPTACCVGCGRSHLHTSRWQPSNSEFPAPVSSSTSSCPAAAQPAWRCSTQPRAASKYLCCCQCTAWSQAVSGAALPYAWQSSVIMARGAVLHCTLQSQVQCWSMAPCS